MLNILIYIFNLNFFYFEIIHVTVEIPPLPKTPLMYLYQIIQCKSDKINPKQMLVIAQIHLCFDCVTSDKTRRDLKRQFAEKAPDLAPDTINLHI